MIMPPYESPFWLPNGHCQTLYAALCSPKAPLYFRRERWNTPDGDFIDLDWTTPELRAPRPLLVLFHGLEGSSESRYARALMQAAIAQQWQGVVVHFRGCSGEENRQPRAYHAGDSVELDWILQRLHAQQAGAPLYAVGVSLGGNALLKWLGEQGRRAATYMSAAAAISAPFDLAAAGDYLAQGFNQRYTQHFLRSMKRKAILKLARYPHLFDRERMLKAQNLRQFDDTVTAPLHGFSSVDDYWSRASSKPYLAHIAIPTLLLNARNDPFLPQSALPTAGEMSASVTAVFSETGGHVGFVSGAPLANWSWLTQTVVQFLQQARSN